MATAPEDLTPPEGEIDENAEAQEPSEEPGEDPYAPLAVKMGWVPKDQFRGDPDKWKPAEDFIIAGHEIQRNVSRELKEIKTTVDLMSRTSASIVEQNIAERRRELEQAHNQAVDDGDAQAARQISSELTRLESSVPRPQSPTVEQWKQENSWFEKDPLATDLAIQTCARLANQGFSHAQQLEAAARIVKKEFPELFPNAEPRPQPPVVRPPASRSSPPSNRQKGFVDLPKEAQAVAIDMENRGVIKSRNDYALQYWKSAERK